MRRIAVFVLLVGILAAGCKRKHHPNPSATIEEESELASSISVAEARDASQLLSGFYGLEGNAWRWSTKKFAVSLAPPATTAPQGASLELDCSLPEVIATRMLGVSVTPTVGTTKLAPIRIDKIGDQTLKFDVPPDALKQDAIIVQFELDKAIAPSASDSRELGIVVARIGFVSK
ncbi:hypothetical protein [uncultured Paludibaculum sp.]|uniref:hypothetical protein n=1 Tax=uncultured Paludibaculum sp. TaxID=1765020 RepID=UPI002AAAF529|nr:hypothetical protein [uncultured Paludibaculum sp.]